MKQFTIANRYGDTKRYTGLVHTDTYTYLLTESKYHHDTLAVDGLNWQDDKKLQSGRFDTIAAKREPFFTAGCANYCFGPDDLSVSLDPRLSGRSVDIEQAEDVPLARREVCIPNHNRAVYQDGVGVGYVNDTLVWCGLTRANYGLNRERLAIDVWHGRSGGIRYAKSIICQLELYARSPWNDVTLMMYHGSGTITQVRAVFVSHLLLRGTADGSLVSLAMSGPDKLDGPVLRVYRPITRPSALRTSIDVIPLDIDMAVNEYWTATDFVISPCGRWLAVSATIERQQDTEVGPYDVTGVQFFEIDYERKIARKRYEYSFPSTHLDYSPDGLTLATFGYGLVKAKRGDSTDYLKPTGQLTVMDIDFI